MAIAPEQSTIIACIVAELIWKNSQLFTRVLRFGIPFLLQSLLWYVFQILGKKTARVFSKIITELAEPHSAALPCYVNVL